VAGILSFGLYLLPPRVLDALGQTAIKRELRQEIGSVRAELALIHQQLMTLNAMMSHHRSEFSRLEDRIARLEAHTGIDELPQY
jgi:septal ring factor EnvC (AmiA/AmiB activator)